MFTRSTELDDREAFGLLLNTRGLMYGNAVEIGTDRGAFARDLLTHWRGPQLYCVDPWEIYRELYQPRQPDLMHAVAALARFGDRVRLLQMTSERATHHVPGPIAFVYVDGLHATRAVLDDCLTWWPRLEPNGILAGHDLQKPRVREAVELFAEHVGHRVYGTGARTGSPSWYIYRDPATEPVPWKVAGWLGRRSPLSGGLS